MDSEIPPIIKAALRAQEGTTPDEIEERFAESTPDRQEDNVFELLYRDALDDWCERNDRYRVPSSVAQQIAAQIRADLAWAQRSR